MWISIKISLKFVSNAPIDNTPALSQIRGQSQSGDRPLSQPMVTHICVNRPCAVNKICGRSWRPTDGILLKHIIRDEDNQFQSSLFMERRDVHIRTLTPATVKLNPRWREEINDKSHMKFHVGVISYSWPWLNSVNPSLWKRPMASFTKEVKPRLNFNVDSANVHLIASGVTGAYQFGGSVEPQGNRSL